MSNYMENREKGKKVHHRAVKNGLVVKDRWGEGIPHHPKSIELMSFLAEHDFQDCDDYFCWKIGGDGDNGEILMYEMDAYFEQKDVDEKD